MRRMPASSPPVPRTVAGVPPRSSTYLRISSWSVVVFVCPAISFTPRVDHMNRRLDRGQRAPLPRSAALAPSAQLAQVHLDRLALRARHWLPPGHQLRPGALGRVVAADVGVVRDRTFVATGDERAAIRVVQVEVLLAAIERPLLPDRELLEQVVLHPAAQLREPVAALERGGTASQVLRFAFHAVPPWSSLGPCCSALSAGCRVRRTGTRWRCRMRRRCRSVRRAAPGPTAAARARAVWCACRPKGCAA